MFLIQVRDVLVENETSEEVPSVPGDCACVNRYSTQADFQQGQLHSEF